MSKNKFWLITGGLLTGVVLVVGLFLFSTSESKNTKTVFWGVHAQQNGDPVQIYNDITAQTRKKPNIFAWHIDWDHGFPKIGRSHV